MAEKTDNSATTCGTSISTESVIIFAESIGFPNLSDECGTVLADDITFQLKTMIQDARKFMIHGKRTKLMPCDINRSLTLRNIQPMYGFEATDAMPFRFAAGDGRELYYTKDKEIDLKDVLAKTEVKLPLDVSLRCHWLAIDGVQPAIPENPAPVSIEEQKLESVNPLAKLRKTENENIISKTGKSVKPRNVETVYVKQLATHELSVEQQLYYKEITEACVGPEESKRIEALRSLANDPGIHAMLPRMCTFIAEGVKVNTMQHNLVILIYLMRMMRSLIHNPALYLEKYLHELIPSAMTCVVSKQLCLRPEADNHWALREFASYLIAKISKTFSNSVNNIQCRVTRLYVDALTNPASFLPTVYGAIHGLAELGPQLVNLCVVPKVKAISCRVDAILEQPTNFSADRTAADHIKNLLNKVLTPILKNKHPDLEEYRNEFGSFGQSLYNSVMKARMTDFPG